MRCEFWNSWNEFIEWLRYLPYHIIWWVNTWTINWRFLLLIVLLMHLNWRCLLFLLNFDVSVIYKFKNTWIFLRLFFFFIFLIFIFFLLNIAFRYWLLYWTCITICLLMNDLILFLFFVINKYHINVFRIFFIHKHIRVDKF